MKGKGFIIPVVAIIMIGAGLFSCVEAKAGRITNATMVARAEAPLVVREAYLGIPVEKNGKIEFQPAGSYVVDPATGCINIVKNIKGMEVKGNDMPRWLDKERKTLDFGSFSNSQCRQGVIGLSGSPTEYWVYANGSYFCIGAWDSACGHWYPECKANTNDYKVCR